MANNFTVTLDTTGPSSPSISYPAYATAQLITVTISTGDGVTTGYQMKIWGDVDGAYDANVQPLEANSAWMTYATSKQVKLSATDGNKTVYLKLRDDVLNESAQASDMITLDTTKPIPSITVGPDVTKVSKIATKDTIQLSFQSDQAIVAWKVKAVASTSDTESMGTQIPTTAGSTNVTGGALAATTNQAVTIKAADLETASPGDGAKIVKVFVQDAAGNWSV